MTVYPDPWVVQVETGEGVYAYHQVTGRLVKLSPAGALLLRCLDAPDPAAAFAASLGVGMQEARRQFAALAEKLAARGLCERV